MLLEPMPAHVPLQAVETASASAQHANAVARDVAASKSAKEAGTKLWVVARQIDSSAWFAKVARALVGTAATLLLADGHDELCRLMHERIPASGNRMTSMAVDMATRRCAYTSSTSAGRT